MPLFFLLQIDAAESTVDRIEDWALDQGLTIVSIVIFAIIAMIALNIIVPRLVRLSTETELGGKSQVEIEKRTKTLTHVFTRTGTTLIVVMGFITILPELGVNIGPLLAGLGIAGIALGFGAQNLVKDVISGVFILTDNQYSTGDVVEVAGKTGVVEDVGLRRTVLRDLDGVVHFVPNGEIVVSSNMTQDYSRVNLDISVSYAEDLDVVMSVINEVGEELAADEDWKDVIMTPPKALRVESFGDSGIDIKILGDVQPLRQWEVTGELRRRLKRRFDEVGIEIPFPHLVLVHEAKAAGLPAAIRMAQGDDLTAPKATDPGTDRDPRRRQSGEASEGGQGEGGQ
ncbi:MAG: mechanosensitive ion channel family protein [Chloroflexi bacterium]|nr:mechanosensitive ion channel family protein [Chloroflexota bacterium]MCI0784096.1 mechanosensitive ion channel family protein [Chloroflexota bacterium]MCI0816661.1 mechanosensitive ion channel family protein [Chloroflexota bacterium]MCI0842137.1 mechanosensitive ion channel family protein [Chloroflexota bacterium]MCI0883593.1 mechanosensitive ion channel family protein [Chloroflexota bacterium]